MAGSEISSWASRAGHPNPSRATALVQTWTSFHLTMQQPPWGPSDSSLAPSNTSPTSATRLRVFIIAPAKNLSRLLIAFKMKSKPLVYSLNSYHSTLHSTQVDCSENLSALA